MMEIVRAPRRIYFTKLVIFNLARRMAELPLVDKSFAASYDCMRYVSVCVCKSCIVSRMEVASL